MADHYFGANMGAAVSGDVATGTSTTSKKVEVRVEDGVSGNNKHQVALALRKIAHYIENAADVTG